MRSAFSLALLIVMLSANAQSVRLLVQSSPLAGFRYGAAAALWPQLRVGDELALVREAGKSWATCRVAKTRQWRARSIARWRCAPA